MKLFRYAALALLALATNAYADTKISAMPAASALGGTEAFPAVQSAANVRATPAQISTYTFSQMTATTVTGKWSGTCNSTTMLGGDGTCRVPPPGGSTTQVQFNNSGALGGDADFLFDAVTNTVTLGSVATPGTLKSIAGSGSQAGAALAIATGAGGTTGASGALTIGTGTTTDGATGAITISTPTPLGTNRSSGNISFTTGTPTGSGTKGVVQVNGNPVSVATSGSWTATAVGCTTSPTQSVRWVRNGADATAAQGTVAASVVISINNAITCTSNSTTFSLTGSPPASILPASGSRIISFVLVRNNGATVNGTATMGSNGTITFGVAPTVGGGFTNSGTMGAEVFTGAYDISP